MMFRLLLILLIFTVPTLAQDDASQPDTNPCFVITETTFTVEPGTVPANSQVAIENVYTGRVDYGTADSEGGFSIETVGLPGMPYHVYSAPSITQAMRSAGELPDSRALLMSQPQEGDFAVGGQLAFGNGTWLARGDFDLSSVQPGEDVRGSMDVVFIAPDANPELPLTVLGEVNLKPIIDQNGLPIAADGSHWSSTLTPSSLPIHNQEEMRGAPLLIDITDDICVDAEAGIFSFSLDFQSIMPTGYADGLYQLVFSGKVAVADSTAVDWYSNRSLGVNGTGEPGDSETALPRVLPVGIVQPILSPIINNQLPDDVPLAVMDGVQFSSETMIHNGENLSLQAPLLTNWLALLGEPELTVNVAGQSITATRIEWDGTNYYLVPDSDPLTLEQSGALTLSGTLSSNFGATPYETTLLIAQPLHLLPAVLPGTPYEIGDTFLPGVTIQPVLPLIDGLADVTLRFYPLSSDEPQTREWSLPVTHGAAVSAEPFTFTEQGHYVVDYAVSGTNADGQLWAGSLRSAGVVESDDRVIVAEGKRGIANYAGDETGQQQAWFDMAMYPNVNPYLPPIVNWPAFGGDVAYLPDRADVGMQPVLTPALDADAFALLSSVRPDVRVQQSVTRPGLSLPNFIWRNDDLLDSQMGAGMAGNREGDLVFLLGGIVDRSGAAMGYASLAVITDENDTARVLPPFQQSIRGDDDLLIIPTTVRPGQTYTLGAVDAFAGQIAPTLPAVVRLTAIAPSGARQSIQSSANRFGHIAAVDRLLSFDEVGVWQIEVDAAFTGQTSIDNVQTPIVGSVPGVETSYAVYVVDSETPALEGPQPQVAPGQPVYLSVTVPGGWTDATAHVTVATASQVLATEDVTISGSRVAYSYNPATYRTTAPNLEANGTGSGPAASDVVTVTFAITGTNANGSSAAAVRTYTILHDRVR